VHGGNQSASVVAGVVADVGGQRGEGKVEVGIGGTHVLQAVDLHDEESEMAGRMLRAAPALRLSAPVAAAAGATSGAAAADIV
jgi:hypothetical protein